jgi:hypothetical protein
MKQVTSYKLLSTKNVDELIANAGASLKTMREKVQVASIGILMHAEKCGDYRKANDLIDILGNGINRASLQKFFVDFGGLKLDDDGKHFVAWKGKDYIKGKFQEAKCTAWWSLKEAPSYKGLDLEAKIATLIKQAESALDKRDELPEEDRAKVSVDLDKLNALRAIITPDSADLLALAS